MLEDFYRGEAGVNLSTDLEIDGGTLDRRRVVGGSRKKMMCNDGIWRLRMCVHKVSGMWHFSGGSCEIR